MSIKTFIRFIHDSIDMNIDIFGNNKNKIGLCNMQRSVMGLIYLIQGMQSAGIDLSDKLHQIGIHPHALDPQGYIQRDLEWKIQNHLTQGYDPHFGIFIGQQYSLSGYGPYLMLLLTSSTVKNAVDEAIYFQQLTYLFGQLEIQIDEKYLYLKYRPVKGYEHSLRTYAEIAGTYKFIKDIYKMLGLQDVEIKVKLAFPYPSEGSNLEQCKLFYGLNAQFDSNETVFACDFSILNQTLSTSDSVMHAVYKKRCEEEIELLGHQTQHEADLVFKIKNFLQLQNGVIPKINDIAIALSLPERTLRHRLSLQNTNFKIIKDDFLKQRAERLLMDQDLTIEEIAVVLGYSEASAFNHAFKRWFGISPKQYSK